MLRTTVASLLLLLASPRPLCAETTALNGWQRIGERAGVEVSARIAEGRTLPAFRAVGVVEGSPYEILAVIQDVPNHPQWMHACIDARVLRRESAAIAVVYNRTDAPWPIGDRTLAVRSEVRELDSGEIWVMMKGTDDPLPPDVGRAVRMRRFAGHYRLQPLPDGETRVELMIDSDPGGRLPPAIARVATRDIPLNTLLNLRRQVARTRGRYSDFIEEWSRR